MIDRMSDEFFQYDGDLPLDAVEDANSLEIDAPNQFHVTFTSARDERVPALLTLPENADLPFPVVLILHGVLGDKGSTNQRKRSEALVAAGYATMRIDGQYRGERAARSAIGIGLQTQYYYRNRDAMIQTTIDMMRTVDYLSTKDEIDMERVGFAGFSMGGAIGTIFCAVDFRIKAAILAITGGDFDKLGMTAPDEASRERLRRAYGVVDPTQYIARISPRPLLMLNATRDEIIPKAATEALFDAALDPKEIKWFDCGHAELPDESIEEMIRFFDSTL